MLLAGYRRWWNLKRAEARLRRARAACAAMRMGPFYDSTEDDATYYGNVVELHAARDAVKAAGGTAR